MATTTQAVNIPATRTHCRHVMSERERRLRTLEELLIKRSRSYVLTSKQMDANDARFWRVFEEITELVMDRDCMCESFT